MSKQSLINQVKRDKVEFISLQFSDLLGVIKEVIIPSQELPGALENGVWFDGSSIEGFARVQESDLFLKPDISTYSLVPWLTDGGRTARIICDINKPDGSPFEGDPRFILKKVLSESFKKGFIYNVGPEPEFYLFKKNDELKTIPADQGSYFDLSSHDGYKIIKEITAALKSFNIHVETSHHEVGEGQYEIDFNYGEALEIADKLLTLKYTVKKIAQIYGYRATFMPKPLKNAAGSGMHVHQSLFKKNKKENLFYRKDDSYQLSPIAYNFIAGQMKHIKAMCAILSPTVNSYKRLISGFEAPIYITWASMNRSALIRVPRWFKNKPQAARLELRCPDPTCNPYLAFAVMLKSGLEGIINNLKPPEPLEEDLYQLDGEDIIQRKIDILPTSLHEALEELKKDHLLKDVLGNHLFQKYIDIKETEWAKFKRQVTEWEINKYLDIY